jgi:hypothetical protein
MSQERSTIVGASAAADRADFWRDVPSTRTWRRATLSRVTPDEWRIDAYRSSIIAAGFDQITRHTMPSLAPRNSMKTKDRASNEVSQLFRPASSEFSVFRGPRR